MIKRISNCNTLELIKYSSNKIVGTYIRTYLRMYVLIVYHERPVSLPTYSYILTHIDESIRKKLCTRGGGVQEVHPICNIYCTANWKNVTEATIDFVQHRDNGAENLKL